MEQGPNGAETRALSELAEAELLELKQAGIEASWEQVALINDLARKVERPASGPNPLHKGIPRRAGSHWLWPFTIQSREWYLWFGDSLPENALHFDALVYAMVNSRKPRAFDKLYDYESARLAVTDLRRRMDCTDEELDRAVEDVMAQEPESDKSIWARQEPREDDARFLERCAVLFGMPPEYLARKLSQTFLLRMMEAHIEQHAEARDGPDPHSPEVIATRNLGAAITKIKQEWSDGER